MHLKALYEEGEEHIPYLTQGETTTQVYPQLSHTITQPSTLVTKPYWIHKRTKETFWGSPSSCSSASFLACFSPYSLIGHWSLAQTLNAGKPKVGFQKTSSAWIAPTVIHSSDVLPSCWAHPGSYLMSTQELVGKVLLQHTSTLTLLAAGKAGRRRQASLAEQFPQTKQCCPAPLSGWWCLYGLSEQLGNKQEKKTQPRK